MRALVAAVLLVCAPALARAADAGTDAAADASDAAEEGAPIIDLPPGSLAGPACVCSMPSSRHDDTKLVIGAALTWIVIGSRRRKT